MDLLRRNNYEIRSYSVLLKYSDGHLVISGEKYYVNPSNAIYSGYTAGNLTLIENYISPDGELVGSNFRIKEKSYDGIKQLLSPIELETILFYKKILPNNCLPFSIAIRNDKLNNVIKTLYIYPTSIHNGRIKATNISDKIILNNFISKLSASLVLSKSYLSELLEIINICAEFRGVGISVYGKDAQKSFNIYLKVPVQNLRFFLTDKILSAESIDLETILISVKIDNNIISGYRLYYKGSYGIPCCGWGSV